MKEQLEQAARKLAGMIAAGGDGRAMLGALAAAAVLIGGLYVSFRRRRGGGGGRRVVVMGGPAAAATSSPWPAVCAVVAVVLGFGFYYDKYRPSGAAKASPAPSPVPTATVSPSPAPTVTQTAIQVVHSGPPLLSGTQILLLAGLAGFVMLGALSMWINVRRRTA